MSNDTTCPDELLPDGPVCPRCGGPRAPSGGGSGGFGAWVHFPRETRAVPKDAAEAERTDLQKLAESHGLTGYDEIDAFINGYAAGLKEAGRWISVQERLPDCHHFVLGLYCSNPAHVVPLIRNEDGTWKSILNGFTADAITHWMPLPPAPSEGE